MRKTRFQSRGFVESNPMIVHPLALRSAGVLPGRSKTGSAVRTPAERGANGKTAYTLIEVLVVAVVVVLMLGMALPVFRVITGSRSEAGATNMIASLLGRARDDAIGLQQPYGVAFMYNPSLQTTALAEVYFPTAQAWVAPAAGQTFTALTVPPQGYIVATNGSYTYYYINPSQTNTVTVSAAPSSSPTESSPPSGMQAVGGPALEIVPDTDLVSLPAGVGVQTVCNCNYGSTAPVQRLSDGYLSFGVILFDSKGRLQSFNYGVSSASKLAQAANLNLDFPVTTQSPPIYSGNNLGVASQFGLVVYQRDAWLNQRAQNLSKIQYSDPLYIDPTSSTGSSEYTSGSPTPLAEENWLDQNATPLLIDRYTGTLIKAE